MKVLLLTACLTLLITAGYAQTVPVTNNPVHYGDSAAKHKIDSIYNRLLLGEPFETLAINLSQDPGSFSVGGSLGWQKPSIYVTEFQDTLNVLRVNQISRPFKTDFGYHIVQLLDRKGDTVLSRHILIRRWD